MTSRLHVQWLIGTEWTIVEPDRTRPAITPVMPTVDSTQRHLSFRGGLDFSTRRSLKREVANEAFEQQKGRRRQKQFSCADSVGQSRRHKPNTDPKCWNQRKLNLFGEGHAVLVMQAGVVGQFEISTASDQLLAIENSVSPADRYTHYIQIFQASRVFGSGTV